MEDHQGRRPARHRTTCWTRWPPRGRRCASRTARPSRSPKTDRSSTRAACGWKWSSSQLDSTLRMATYFITGGAGFLGINLTRYLLARGETVVSFDVQEFDYPERDRIRHVTGDIRDKPAVDARSSWRPRAPTGWSSSTPR